MNRKQKARKHARRRAHGISVAEAREKQRTFAEQLNSLEKMTKPELIRFADDHGIVVAKSWNKSLIIQSIREGLRSRREELPSALKKVA